MDGVMDLSSETFNQLENIPTAAGRGWLASNLKRDDWTVKTLGRRIQRDCDNGR
jgi:hypothetical protein